MNNIDERYQPPISQADPSQKMPLTKEEWRYAGKMYFLMSFGAALLYGIWPAWERREWIAGPKSSVGSPGNVAAIEIVFATRHFGAVVALFGVLMALFLVVRKRRKAGMPPPNHGLFWPMLLSVPLGAPLFGFVMLGAGTAFVRVVYGSISSSMLQLVWEGRMIAMTHVGLTLGTVVAIGYALSGTALARGAAWAYKWPLPVSAVCWFVSVGSMELLAYPVKLALLPIRLSPPF